MKTIMGPNLALVSSIDEGETLVSLRRTTDEDDDTIHQLWNDKKP